MLPKYLQGKIRTVPQSSEDLHAENLGSAAQTTSDKTPLEDAKSGEPKAEDRQVGEPNTEAVAKGNKPQRTRSHPAGPREPALGIGRRPTRRGAENKAQNRHGEEEDRFQRTVPRTIGPREPAPTPTTPLQESYGDITDIPNTYHFRDSFYERYIPWNIGSGVDNRPQNMDSEVPLVSRFDWTSSESDDGWGRAVLREQKRRWKRRLDHLKQLLKGQKTKIVRSIGSAVIFKTKGGRR